jgi:hypothetical protein
VQRLFDSFFFLSIAIIAWFGSSCFLIVIVAWLSSLLSHLPFDLVRFFSLSHKSSSLVWLFLLSHLPSDLGRFFLAPHQLSGLVEFFLCFSLAF